LRRIGKQITLRTQSSRPPASGHILKRVIFVPLIVVAVRFIALDPSRSLIVPKKKNKSRLEGLGNRLGRGSIIYLKFRLVEERCDIINIIHKTQIVDHKALTSTGRPPPPPFPVVLCVAFRWAGWTWSWLRPRWMTLLPWSVSSRKTGSLKFNATSLPGYQPENPGGTFGRTLTPQLFPADELGDLRATLTASTKFPGPILLGGNPTRYQFD